ncbi:MAG: cell wall-binding repeat-containing protein [Phycicoccus sp.]|nr:cell wall-binding repeat-containing protein [Phycicoccus sp.]
MTVPMAPAEAAAPIDVPADGVASRLDATAAAVAPGPTITVGDTELASTTVNRSAGELWAAGGSDVLPDSSATNVATITDRSLVRLAGPDRYDTSVALSQKAFPTGASKVFIATGENFPDGLAASAVAGQLGAPVLLTTGAALPASVQTEILRLAPTTVYLVGGSDVVSNAVGTTVSSILPGATVTRVSGADRNDTAEQLARLLPTQNKAAFLATGENFPDALAAAPAAALAKGPLLLTWNSGLAPASAAELARLRPAVTYIVGGSDVVSTAIENAVRSASGGSVVRLAGDDRYATAEAIADHFGSSSVPVIGIATGEDYPDALGAGAAVASKSGLILLDPGTGASSRAEVDSAKRHSWWVPTSGKVIRWIPIVHPDDEMSSVSVWGARDPNRYDVYVLLSTGEGTGYCSGGTISNPWQSIEYLPPQPMPAIGTDACKSLRLGSWANFLGSTGASVPTSGWTSRTGESVTYDGTDMGTPVRVDANGSTVDATGFRTWVGPKHAVFQFDLGEMTMDEVTWALANSRALTGILPTQVEGEIIGGGYHNDTSSGSIYIHADHEALNYALRYRNFGTEGSQYDPVGHTMPLRTFGAFDYDYCTHMCHPASTNGWTSAATSAAIGDFQYHYGWLHDGYWPTGSVDALAGFAQYQSFNKTY